MLIIERDNIININYSVFSPIKFTIIMGVFIKLLLQMKDMLNVYLNEPNLFSQSEWDFYLYSFIFLSFLCISGNIIKMISRISGVYYRNKAIAQSL